MRSSNSLIVGPKWDDLEADVREAWLLAARFAPETVGTELSEACGLDEDALEKLADSHLIAGDRNRWRMHRLVRAFGRSGDRPWNRRTYSH